MAEAKHTPLDLDAMEKMALAATPGPWAVDDRRLTHPTSGLRSGGGGLLVQSVPRDGSSFNVAAINPWGGGKDADAAFIATFDPPTVLRLVDTQRGLLEALKALKGHLLIPAAEYVPAIPEAWALINAAIAKAEGRP